MIDVVVIGSGISGLACAQQLNQAGYSVLVLEKSQVLGGRVATIPINNTVADQGTCYLKPKGKLMGSFVELLQERNIVRVWTDTVHDLSIKNSLPLLKLSASNPRYVSPGGMNNIAQFLSNNLTILFDRQVESISETSEKTWCLVAKTNQGKTEEIEAKSVVVAIPAPQALALLNKNTETLLGVDFMEKLSSVEFFSCLTVTAGYSPSVKPLPEWKALTFEGDKIVGWIGYESTKRHSSQQPVFVIHSNIDYAKNHLEDKDLQPVIEEILERASSSLMLPWLESPEWSQIHRWCHAIPRNPLTETSLAAKTNSPLVCCGDWCGGGVVENALVSGIAVANHINTHLNNLSLAQENFLAYLK